MTDKSEIAHAVDRLFRVARGDEARSLAGIADALSRDRDRTLLIQEHADLPAGVFGQWIRHPDHDEVRYATWVHARERTIAHELGHIALGHAGRPAIELATSYLREDFHDLAALMLQRECTEAQSTEEAEAEAFGSLLLKRLKGSSLANRSPAVRSRLDEALG